MDRNTLSFNSSTSGGEGKALEMQMGPFSHHKFLKCACTSHFMIYMLQWCTAGSGKARRLNEAEAVRSGDCKFVMRSSWGRERAFVQCM